MVTLGGLGPRRPQSWIGRRFGFRGEDIVSVECDKRGNQGMMVAKRGKVELRGLQSETGGYMLYINSGVLSW
jgi:hypothetical protein